MSNVIQFPIKPRITRMQNDIEEEYYQQMIDQENCVEMSQYLFKIIQSALLEQDWVAEFKSIDFNDSEKYEAQDMFVILNMIASMLLRFRGYNHMLQKDMDKLTEKLVLAQEAAGFDYDDEYWDDE